MDVGFDDLFDELKAFNKPPIDKWHPVKVVQIDLVVKANGEWFYQGSIIGRHRLVKLFSTVLRKEGDSYYLVTPQVKYRIDVEEVPFRAVELNRRKSGFDEELYFRTNMDEVVMADAEHPIVVEIDENTQHPLPFVVVRDGLRAKISRSVFYELVEMAQPKRAPCEDGIKWANGLGETLITEEGYQSLGVYSGGAFFSLGEM